jgi:hypothetical protein
VELAGLGADLGDVEVEVADRVGLEALLARPLALGAGRREMPWRCRQRCRLERVSAGIVGWSA